MPQTIKHKRVAPGIRRRTVQRKNKTRSGCKIGSRSTKKNPGIIANSIFALKLQAIPGIVRADKVGDRSRGKYGKFRDFDILDNYEQMYHDLLASVQNACRLKGINTIVDPYKSGMSLESSLVYVNDLFQNEILPKGWEFNVDRDDNGYYFTIYTFCEFDWYWHAFEVKFLLAYLAETNQELHELFICFLHSFSSSTDIQLWYNGALGYADYYFFEEVENWWDNHDIDDKDDQKAYEEVLKTHADYTTGSAKQYENAIKSSPLLSANQLINRLKKFPKSKVAKWMIEACEFMKLNGAYMNGFIYEGLEETSEGLQFDQQVGIIWDWNDQYSYAQGEAMDVDANEIGAILPCLYYHITPDTEKFDETDLLQQMLIPNKISELFDSYYKVVNPIKNKIKNAKRKNRIAA